MTKLHAILLVFSVIVAFVVIAGGWDIYVGCIAKAPEQTWCEAFRELNRHSNGLLGLTWCFGWLALTLHLLFLPWLPSWWTHLVAGMVK